MTLKSLSAVALVTAALASPAFAQDSDAPQKPVHALRHYRGSYNQVQEPEFAAPRAPVSGSYFDHDSYDPSRIGGRNPNFNPPS
jgi:hypothetical protein